MRNAQCGTRNEIENDRTDALRGGSEFTRRRHCEAVDDDAHQQQKRRWVIPAAIRRACSTRWNQQPPREA